MLYVNTSHLDLVRGFAKLVGYKFFDTTIKNYFWVISDSYLYITHTDKTRRLLNQIGLCYKLSKQPIIQL